MGGIAALLVDHTIVRGKQRCILDTDEEIEVIGRCRRTLHGCRSAK
jgi:hypothetical protein